MKIDGGRIINDFIEPNKRQYAIPVYQRNYEWSREQCVKLFEDIVEAYKSDNNHFCGSVVYALLDIKHNINYYVIVDGQQRLTTIYILIKALLDMAETEGQKELLEETLYNRDKYDEFDIDTASKLKLKPIKSDNNQLMYLMDGKYEKIDKSCDIWINYNIFKDEIKKVLEDDDNLDIKKIYKGIEKLTCAMIKLDDDDNAQEIFERINSTGVPLSLADKIRNFVLMTDVEQERLYEDYWLETERLVDKKQMSDFFLDFLNLKVEGFTKEKDAYDVFKQVFKNGNYTNEEILIEIVHYADYYNTFTSGNKKYSKKLNEYLKNIKQLKQTTVYLFLYRVFDDFNNGDIDMGELEKVLQLIVSYSIRRIICEVSSNTLRGLYKTLYNRVFIQESNKSIYYDSIVSFMQQLTSKDVIPLDDDFEYALMNNNLFGKHALCRFLLISIENQGKEKLETENLTIEHVMPQNKNLSTEWRKMLGENWEYDKDKWLHTLGNLTLTGYNSELGDKPFLEKKEMIEEKQTKVVNLYSDIQTADKWDAEHIQKRAERLIKQIKELFPIINPKNKVEFVDPRYKDYTCEEPENATYKTPSHYELLGERVNVSNFADMMRSVAKKLYELDSRIIEKMARNDEILPEWNGIAFSYNKDKVKSDVKIRGTEIYIISNYSAANCVSFIRALLRKYDLDIAEDFIYNAKGDNK